MSVTFFAPDAQAATQDLEINMASVNAGQLTVLLDLDTQAAIQERGMVAGEFAAATVVAACRGWNLDTMADRYMAERVRELAALAEAAQKHGSTVAWA
jgi:hypothetical protein